MAATQTETPLFSFGIIADVQYADTDDAYNYSKTKMRYYRNSINLLKDAVAEWNKMSSKPEFVFQLGDLIDGRNNRHEGMTQSSWKRTIDELSAFNGDVYHTFGNHEYYNFTHKELAELLPSMTLPKTKGTETSGPPRLRYTFNPHEKCTFVVLDSYEISTLGYNKEDPEYIQGMEMLKSVNKNKDLNSTEGLTGKDNKFVQYNGALGQEQINWLDNQLAQAEESGRIVIIFAHVQLIQTKSPNVVWDTEKVLQVLHRYQCVAAVICGHDHDGDFLVDEHGIHHIVMPGVIETKPDDQAYATVHVYDDKLKLVGVGTQVPNITVTLNSRKCFVGEH